MNIDDDEEREQFIDTCLAIVMGIVLFISLMLFIAAGSS